MPRPKMCEGCKEKRANYGLLNTRERKWCFTCAERYVRGLKWRDRVRPSKAEFPPDASKGDVMRRLATIDD